MRHELARACSALRTQEASPERTAAALARVRMRLETEPPARVYAWPDEPGRVRRRFRPWWLVAAAFLLTLALLARLPFTAKPEARLLSLRGALTVAGRSIVPGAAVAFRQTLRTGPAADAVLQLPDGSQVEIGASSALRLRSSPFSTTAALATGRVVVEAAHQGWLHHFYVATPDCQVAVKGTIFAVDATDKGSRVAVVRGVVSVSGLRSTQWLMAGDETTTSPRLPRLGVVATVAWSRRAATYAALLGAVPSSLPANTPATPIVSAPPASPSPAPQEAATQAVKKPPAAEPAERKPAAPAAAPAPAPAPPPPDPNLEILQSAVAAVADVPEEVQPQYLLNIGDQMDVHHPRAAAKVFQRAFEQAQALSLPGDTSDPAYRLRHFMKAFVESEAIVELLGTPGNFDLAHSLARRMDVPCGRTYNNLVIAAANPDSDAPSPWPMGVDLPTGPGIPAYILAHPSPKPPGPRPPARDVVALARECQAAGGGYPYLGVEEASEKLQMPPADQLAWMREAIAAAGKETSTQGIHSASFLLGKVHEKFPQLDSLIEAAAIADLHALAAAVPASPSVGARAELDRESRADGKTLLLLIGKIDPDDSSRLNLEYSQFAAPPQFAGESFNQILAPQRKANADPASALAEAERTPDEDARFRALVNTAVVLAAKNPQPAATAAADALNLLNPQRLTKNLLQVAKLAQRMDADLGEHQQAVVLITRCLDESERQADAIQEQSRDVAPAGMSKFYDQFLGFPINGDLVEVFGFAAEISPNLALQRAQQTNSTLLKPLFLMRAATLPFAAASEN
ncbi:MAG TPA: FecR family protein [Terriglobales bacterium]|nr:FecR family protein [Terriglobales bacterium]